jgi:hypothetical protein
LQLGAPCSTLPTPWIEPVSRPLRIEPSARTVAVHRRCLSNSSAPGARNPASTSAPNATFGALRLLCIVSSALSSSGSACSIRSSAAAR